MDTKNSFNSLELVIKLKLMKPNFYDFRYACFIRGSIK